MTITKENISPEEAKLVALAETDIAFCPRYFHEGEGVFEASTSTLEKFFTKENIQTSRVPPNRSEKNWEIIEKSILTNLILPTIIFSSDCFFKNPELINVLIAVISNYINDCLSHIGNKHSIKLRIVYKDKKITYDGSLEGLKEIKFVLEKMDNE